MKTFTSLLLVASAAIVAAGPFDKRAISCPANSLQSALQTNAAVADKFCKSYVGVPILTSTATPNTVTVKGVKTSTKSVTSGTTTKSTTITSTKTLSVVKVSNVLVFSTKDVASTKLSTKLATVTVVKSSTSTSTETDTSTRAITAATVNIVVTQTLPDTDSTALAKRAGVPYPSFIPTTVPASSVSTACSCYLFTEKSGTKKVVTTTLKAVTSTSYTKTTTLSVKVPKVVIKAVSMTVTVSFTTTKFPEITSVIIKTITVSATSTKVNTVDSIADFAVTVTTTQPFTTNLYPTNTATVTTFYPANPSATNIGCWHEPVVDRALVDRYYIISTNNHAQCIAQCNNEGFYFAGMEYGEECYCGNILSDQATKVDDGSCNMACPGDASETCGGGYLLNIFQLNSNGVIPTPVQQAPPPAYESIGCFLEGVSMRALAYEKDSVDTTIQGCIDYCWSIGQFTFASVEYGSQCFCGNTLTAGWSVGEESDCSKPCEGDATGQTICGGNSAFNLYGIPGYTIDYPTDPTN